MSFIKKTARNIWVGIKYWGMRTGGWLSTRVPLRVAYWLGAGVGDFIYLTWRRHSANAVSNMRRVLGEHADWRVVKITARDSFRNYAKFIVDMLRLPYLDRDEIDRAVSKQLGLQYFDQAFERGKGIIVITGHIGNWDLAGAVLGSRGLPLHAVADSYEPQKMDDLINGSRRKHGIHIIKLETSALRDIFTALRNNGMVLLLFDRPQPDEGVPVQFFGETAYLPAGPAAIALRTGASIIIGYCVRNRGDKTFLGAAEPPIEYEHLLTGDKERDIQIITQQIVSRMEEVIRKYPDQWYMFREMWPRTERHNAEIKRRRFWGGRRPRERHAQMAS